MKILILSSTNPSCGKAPFVYRFVCNLARAFPKSYILFHVPAIDDSALRLQYPKNVECIEFKYAPNRFRLFSENSIPDLFRAKSLAIALIPLFSLVQFFSLITIIRRERPAIAISFWLIPQSIYISLINNFLRRSKIHNWAIVAGSDILFLERFRNLFSKLYRMTQCPEIISAVSENFRHRLENLCFFSKTQIKKNSLGYNSDLFGAANLILKDSEKFSLIFIGRLEKQKDPLRALELFRIFLEFSPGATFTIVGEGTLIHEIRRFIFQNRLTEKVEILPTLTQIEVVNALRNSTILLFTSRLNEGVPTVIQEAMAEQVLVIATPVGGVSEIVIEAESGFLLESNAAKDRQSIESIFSRKGDWGKIIENGKIQAQDYGDVRLIQFWIEEISNTKVGIE